MASDGDCPSQYQFEPWSVWTEHLGRDSPISDDDDSERKPQADAMRLPKEDMGLFGHCPERDPFYTVVCELCSALVKPQGLRHHMDLWHKVTNMEGSHIMEAAEKAINRSVVGPKSGAGNKAGAGNVKIKVKKPANTSNVEVECVVATDQEQPCATNIITTSDGIVSIPEDEKFTVQLENASVSVSHNQPGAAGSVSLQPVVALAPLPSADELATIMSILPRLYSQLISGPLAPGASATLSVSTVSGDQRLCTSPPKKKQKSERLPTKERAYDPDKHCGVRNEESNKPCTRALTCKTHSMSMRRAVKGRSKHFDKLLADYKAAKELISKPSKASGIVQVTPVGSGGRQLLTPVNGSTTVVTTTEVTVTRTGSSSAPTSEIPPSSVQSSNAFTQSHVYTSVVPLVPSLPDMTIDTFETRTPLSQLPTKTSVLSSVAQFASDMCHFPRPHDVKLGSKLEDNTFARIHPKPVTVSTHTSRKFGGVMSNSRRVELFRHGIRTALSQGCIQIPRSSDCFGVSVHATVNHTSSNMKTVLTNISAKGGLLSATSKLLLPNCSIFKSHRSALVSSSGARKLNQTSLSLANALVSTGHLKTVLPKPSVTSVKNILNHSNSSTSDSSLKNGQFHLPNILSASLKRPLEPYKSNSGVNIKRQYKRKTNLNPAEVFGTLLARKQSNHISSSPNPMPLVAVAVPNGLTVPGANTSQGEGGDVKAMFSPRSVVVPDGLLTELSPKTLTSNSVPTLPDSTSSTSSVKAPAPMASALVTTAASQITYLNAAPVSFQQIPVLNSQVLTEVQLQGDAKAEPVNSLPIKLLSHEGTAARTILVAQDVTRPSAES